MYARQAGTVLILAFLRSQVIHSRWQQLLLCLQQPPLGCHLGLTCHILLVYQQGLTNQDQIQHCRAVAERGLSDLMAYAQISSTADGGSYAINLKVCVEGYVGTAAA